MGLPRHQWLKEVDQAPDMSNIRRQKDKYIRETMSIRQEMSSLFADETQSQQAVKKLSPEEELATKGSKKKRENVNEALRMYRMLRPDVEPFFEEDAMLTMQAKANKLALEQAPDDAHKALGPTMLVDPFKAYLPVVNQKAFLLALESVTQSLADDVETMLLLAGMRQDEIDESVPKDHPLRFKLLLDELFGLFPLKKDPSRVDDFMEEAWPRLKLLLPAEIAGLQPEVVRQWLRGHLQRVRWNQRRHAPKILLHSQAETFGNEEFYNFAEDFPYDDDPMPGLLADERNLDFPIHRAGEFMGDMLRALGTSPVAKSSAGASASSSSGGGGASVGEVAAGEEGGAVASQFQDFVWELEKIGLRNWLKMDVADLERHLPRGKVCQLRFDGDSAKFSREDSAEAIKVDKDDVEVAKLMLRCAARGRSDLLEFEAVDPYKLLHNLPAREVDEELASLPSHPDLADAELGGLVDEYRRRHTGSGDMPRAADSKVVQAKTSAWLGEGATIEDIYKKELDFYRTAGPVEWTEGDSGEYSWKWRQPPNTFWDERRRVYIQVQRGLNPNLNLKEMRQHMLDVTRMGSMVKVGRINYFRAIVVVGNGKGVYGFGVGFGNSPKEARADASLKALQNLDYIDLDVGRMLCTPTRGQEYKHMVTIVSRPIGRGLQANKKFLPLLYILGLDNCKVSFMHRKWFTRMRALKRALDMIISRRTLANMTGQRHALLVAPGDHWVHWPDKWFEAIREPYDAGADKIKRARRHALHFKSRGGEVDRLEVRGGWRKDNWIRWNNPLERWLQQKRSFKKQPKVYQDSQNIKAQEREEAAEARKARRTPLEPAQQARIP